MILSNGLRVKNWDTEEALDFNKLNADLNHYYNNNYNIILEGFCLRSDLITLKPNIHIHLFCSFEE